MCNYIFDKISYFEDYKLCKKKSDYVIGQGFLCVVGDYYIEAYQKQVHNYRLEKYYFYIHTKNKSLSYFRKYTKEVNGKNVFEFEEINGVLTNFKFEIIKVNFKNDNYWIRSKNYNEFQDRRCISYIEDKLVNSFNFNENFELKFKKKNEDFLFFSTKNI